MDLKEWDKSSEHRYILHLIDAFTRYLQSVFLNKKSSSLVTEKVMTHWVRIFGTPSRIWSDNGGKFSSEEMQDLSDNLGIEVSTGAAFSPWMNGINERQHNVIDRMLEKMMFENQGMNREVALRWACNAKNALQMQN